MVSIKKFISKIFANNKKLISLNFNENILNLQNSTFEDMQVEVSEQDGVISMHIGSPTIQSSMRIDNPFHLELDYTQAMSMAALFLNTPKEILCIGLGGGTMPKFFYRLFAKTKLTILELNPKVIQIAKHFFKLPVSKKRFNILQGDGIEFIKETESKYNLLLSDAFEDFGLPEEFCTISYFESCRNVLSEKGIFMINLWGSDPKTPLYRDRINLVFDKQVLYVESSKPGNVIVFAFNEKNVEYPINILKQKIKSLEVNYGLDLMVYFSRLIKNNKRGTSKSIRFH
jgi:spermidine synthase